MRRFFIKVFGLVSAEELQFINNSLIVINLKLDHILEASVDPAKLADITNKVNAAAKALKTSAGKLKTSSDAAS